MSGVFRNIDLPPPHRPASVYPPVFGAGVGHTRWVERGWRVNSSEDARHCSVLYICKYFVVFCMSRFDGPVIKNSVGMTKVGSILIIDSSIIPDHKCVPLTNPGHKKSSFSYFLLNYYILFCYGN